MAKQGPKPGEIPKQVIPLPDPPSDADSAAMSDGSITASVFLPGDGSVVTCDMYTIDLERQLQQSPSPPIVASPKLPRHSALKNHSPYSSSSRNSSSNKKKVTLMTPALSHNHRDHDQTTISSTKRSAEDDSQLSKHQDDENTNKERPRYCCCSPTIIYTLIGFTITAAVVVVGINMLLYFDNSKDNGGMEHVPTAPPSRDIAKPSPSVPPLSPDSGTSSNNSSSSNNATTTDNSKNGTSTESMIISILTEQFRIDLPSFDNDDAKETPVYKAIQWLVKEASSYVTQTQSSSTTDVTTVDTGIALYNDLEAFAQRFALLTMRYALASTSTIPTSSTTASTGTSSLSRDFATFPQMGQDECLWNGVTCNENGKVSRIDFSDSGLSGTIPPEMRLLQHLQVLDLSANQLHGTLPDEFYDLRSLQRLYLYHNQLEGTLSPYIGQWRELEYLHLSHNKFTGNIPRQLQSGTDWTRPLKYLNLYSNSLTGSIPENLRLSELYYFDVGRNNLQGTIPADMGNDFNSLRYLHIDHNRLSGSIPETIPPMGNGRLFSFFASHNFLSGRVPDNWVMFNKLVQYTLHENRFDELGENNCRFNVFAGGELCEFKADCNICSCNDIFCQRMCQDGN